MSFALCCLSPYTLPVISPPALLQEEFLVLLAALLSMPGPGPVHGAMLLQGGVKLQVCVCVCVGGGGLMWGWGLLLGGGGGLQVG